MEDPLEGDTEWVLDLSGQDWILNTRGGIWWTICWMITSLFSHTPSLRWACSAVLQVTMYKYASYKKISLYVAVDGHFFFYFWRMNMSSEQYKSESTSNSKKVYITVKFKHL